MEKRVSSAPRAVKATKAVKTVNKVNRANNRENLQNQRNQPAKPKAKTGHIDFPFLLLVLVILVIGLISLFSASHPYAYYYRADSYEFIYKQVVFAALGIPVMLVASLVDYRIYEKLAWLMTIGTIVLLGLVFMFDKIKGARRWIRIGNFSFQPSEIAKFTIVVVFAMLIKVNEHRIREIRTLFPFLLILGTYMILILIEPHMSGAILIALIGAVMLFVGGFPVRYLLGTGALGLGALFLVLKSGLISYTGNRIAAWIDPWEFPRGIGQQNIQAFYAMSSGGLMGVGIGKSTQKHLYLPEPQNDFIFAIVCEEVGFVGAVIILILFALLVWRGFVIATRCPDRFGSLVAIGLTSQIAIQVLLNILVVTNTIPNTGIPLPFFSAGGTSLIMLLAQMGVILSISRHRIPKDTQEDRR